jgi:hypothetical protein
VTELGDIERNMRSCRTKACAVYWARKLVQARFDAGEYPMIQALTTETKEFLARALIADFWKDHE